MSSNIETREALVVKVPFEETEKFGKNQLNRNVCKSQVSKLKKGMLKAFDLFPPVTINQRTYHIIDGQHRIEAYRSLIQEGLLSSDNQIKVMYVDLDPESEKEAIIDANTSSKNWSIDDYIMSYAKQGIEDYVTLKEWCLTHELTNENGKAKFRYGAAIITGKGCANILKNGQFRLTKDMLAIAEIVHDEMIKILDIWNIAKKGHKIEQLAIIWNDVRTLHPFSEWQKMFEKMAKLKNGPTPGSGDKQSDWEVVFDNASKRILKAKEKKSSEL